MPTASFWLIHVASAAVGLVAFLLFKLFLSRHLVQAEPAGAAGLDSLPRLGRQREQGDEALGERPVALDRERALRFERLQRHAAIDRARRSPAAGR